jgi:hypothetical protein
VWEQEVPFGPITITVADALANPPLGRRPVVEAEGRSGGVAADAAPHVIEPVSVASGAADE